MMLQMLARHSTHAKHAPATPPAAPAASAPEVSPSAASAPAAAPPAAPAPAQQHAMIQLSTMIPPRIPQTAGLAVCGALLPTSGALGPATAGSGASGTVGRAPATLSAVPVKPFPTVEVAPVTAASGVWRRVPNVPDPKLTKRTTAQRTGTPDMSPSASCEALRSNWIMCECLAIGNRPE